MKVKRIIRVCVLCLLLAASAAGAVFFLREGVRKAEKPELSGARDFTIEAGGRLPDLKEGLEARNVETVTVDVSQVDTSTAGVYPIMYHYVSTSGKTYQKKVTCTVVEPEAPVAGPEEDQDKNTEQENSTAAGEIPAAAAKTGEVQALAVWAVSCGVAGTVACICLARRKTERRI